MQRADVVKSFPDATDDQINAIMALHQSELQAEKKNAEEWKNKAGQAQTLEEQIAELERQKSEAEKQKEEAENKGLSEVELLKKELAKNQTSSDKQIAELKAQLATSEINAYASSKNLTGESMANVLKAFGGDIELSKTAIDSLVTFVEEREKAAVAAFELELQAKTQSPGGNKGGTDGGDDTAMQLAKSLTPTKSGVNEDLLKGLRR